MPQPLATGGHHSEQPTKNLNLCPSVFTSGAVQVYLTWIPLVYIFNTNLLEILLSLFPRPEFRNLALQCLTEVGALPEVGEEHNHKFLLLFQHFMTSLLGVLPVSMNVAEVRRNPSCHLQHTARCHAPLQMPFTFSCC